MANDGTIKLTGDRGRSVLKTGGDDKPGFGLYPVSLVFRVLSICERASKAHT